ncbi:dienelactone hydrolase [Microbacterium sp. 4R-513]|uniref:dienelactone hydrolase family protein n=1 Tax=Microbacterium sp. 4R-513 TaxID=2567934 RepID=UPI0013E1FB33|nr:dienelactone hydrolase family protein [Microbacterium sp. 4R-513]QIG38876.1 dienelactone hydrolase [Microbacterium sp. 4R-513]
MADVLMFHHVLGLTAGMRDFADRLRAGGHTVHAPDLYDGRIFDSMEDAFAFVQSGAVDVDGRADAAAADLPERLVYLGVSSGVMRAQRLAQQRPGAAGAVLLESAIPVSGEWAFGRWPDNVPVQIHGKDADEFFAGEGDIDAAREIVAAVDDGELFTYPGEQHLFEDSSLPSYDAEATDLLVSRVLAFLDRVDH